MYGCRRPKVCPPIVHPTKCCETHSFQTVIVPHIHPVHTTNFHHELVQNQHFFPQTQSNVQSVQQQNKFCGRPSFRCGRRFC